MGERWQVLEGDCVTVLAGMEAESVDSVVCDPPYGIGFMGKVWDGKAIADAAARDRATRKSLGPESASRPGRAQARSSSAFGNEAIIAGPVRGGQDFQRWCEGWAAEAFRVLKPGGHLLAFGGTRTYHRLGCAIEEAGFEVRDCLAWLYGSGFPKSRNLSGEWEGWGTALKPGHEPIVLARKPLVGTVAANVVAHGTGGLNIAGCRIGWRDDADEQEAKEKNRHADFGSSARENQVYGADTRERGQLGNYDAPGRWPANVLLDSEAAAILDEQTGEMRAGRPSGAHDRHNASDGRGVSMGAGWAGAVTKGVDDDHGGASRFFYVAKASSAERNAGLDGFPERGTTSDGYGSIQTPKLARAAPRENWTPYPVRNVHPTVKPIGLMRWLCRLVTPAGGIVLDPFTGSGTTGCAAALEGFRFVGIERDPEYVSIARARIGWWAAQPQGAEVVAALEGAARRRGIAQTGQMELSA